LLLLPLNFSLGNFIIIQLSHFLKHYEIQTFDFIINLLEFLFQIKFVIKMGFNLLL